MAHRFRGLGILSIALCALCASGVTLAEPTVLLASGERPPYLGASLLEGGYVAEVVSEAFRRKGYRVQLQFSTWTRARVQAERGDAAGMIVALSDSSKGDFVYSKRFYGGTTGLLKKRTLALAGEAGAVRKADAVFKALGQYRFGAVRDGVTLPGFDNAAALRREWTLNDLKSLDLLEQDQIDLAVIDKFAAADLMVSQRPHLIGKLEFMKAPLAQADYALAFSPRTQDHKLLLAAFNDGLAQIGRDGTLEKIMNRHGIFPPRKGNGAKVTLTVGTVNNSDMAVMQQLAHAFEAQNPRIAIDWRVLDENTLRRRLLGDLAIGDGQFDVMTIGTYELPIWARHGWLAPLTRLPASYAVDDLLPAVRKHLSIEAQLYALPFYAESAMTYYRRDLFDKAGLVMPARPSFEEIGALAAKIHDPAAGVYGICLRGKPGWGENMALVSTMVHARGGRWFDEKWRPELTSAAWNAAVSMYADWLARFGPPTPERNGFNENLALFAGGHCGIWIDATVAAGSLFDPKRSSVAGTLGFAAAPGSGAKGGAWLWSWALAIPRTSPHHAQAEQFIAWATSQHYIQSVAERHGWVAVPPGTRASTYANANYLKAAPFARFVQEAIAQADSVDARSIGAPYPPLQYVSIPEFQAIGDRTGLEIANALKREQNVDKALKRAQNFALEQMQGAQP